MITVILASASATLAAEYEGSGDTGWRHANQRDCCEEAVALAQRDSMAACTATGGVPKMRSGARRGLCDWEASGDLENVLYRCTATAHVDCR